MKKTPIIVIIIGCLLLLANISVAAGTVVNRLDLTKKEIEKPIQEIDYQLEDDSTASLSEENKDVALQQSEESVSEEVEEGETVEKSANQGNFHGHRVTLKIANAGGPYSDKKTHPLHLMDHIVSTYPAPHTYGILEMTTTGHMAMVYIQPMHTVETEFIMQH